MHDDCGIVLIRLKKPLRHYANRYGSALYGLSSLLLLMQKQHNRGQDGAGIAAVKLDMPPGAPYLFRKREYKDDPIARLFRPLFAEYDRCMNEGLIAPNSTESLKHQFPYASELYLGHVRYGTSGGYGLRALHPYFKKSSWAAKNLLLAGNSNLTNIGQLREFLANNGLHPVFATDTQALLEVLGHYLDQEHGRQHNELEISGLRGPALYRTLQERLDLFGVLQRSLTSLDGGYALVGATGNGRAFAARDPLGIRPAYYFDTDELLAVASERPPLQTAFEARREQVRELPPGHVLLAETDGSVRLEQFADNRRRAACSFERIYFSRGNGADIYTERKALGAALCSAVLKAIGGDLTQTVFGYIPNTAETAYLGLMQELARHRRRLLAGTIVAAAARQHLTQELVERLLEQTPLRSEKIAHKDVKLRTFIAEQGLRGELMKHIYDVTYGVVEAGDTLVVVDDSIVRGTTLKSSILQILSRLDPRRIVVASTAPQVRYPDCYGIDMADLGELVAFRAVMNLLTEEGRHGLIQEVYARCREQLEGNQRATENEVQALYAPYTPEQISARIAELVRPVNDHWHGELVLVFQSIHGIRQALPQHQGDWYFTGNYPTRGGHRVVHQAFVNYIEGQHGRSY